MVRRSEFGEGADAETEWFEWDVDDVTYRILKTEVSPDVRRVLQAAADDDTNVLLWIDEGRLTAVRRIRDIRGRVD